MAPPYERPSPPVPATWPAAPAGGVAPTEAALPSVGYRDIFRDPRLRTLLEQALANNRDLRAAAANIVVARAQYRVQRASQFPQIDAGADAGYTDRGARGGNASRGNFAANVGTASFEADLFGRLASLSEAERNRLFSSEATAQAVRLALIGDVADAWLSYAADSSLLQIAEQTAATSERIVGLTERRLNGDVAPRSDVLQAEQVRSAALADIADQRTAIAQDRNALRLLVGAEIDPSLLSASIEQAGQTVSALPPGLDSGVLLRRPDVVAAEYDLRAANAEIGAARAALFPRITLTGALGFASNALATLFTGGAFAFSGAGSAVYPIFRAGAGRAALDASKGRRDAVLATYEKAIQAAFRDVSDALARRATIADRTAALEAQQHAAAGTLGLAEMRYRGGIDSFLTTLDAQRSLYSAQRTLAASRLIAASNLVALYRSLGGDATLAAGRNGPVPAGSVAASGGGAL